VEEEFLEKWHFSQAQYQAADLHNAYLLICHHKKRRNSKTYSTNINSFSKAPLDSYPPNLSTLKSNPMPSLSMDVHSLFQKPMKAWYTMKLITFATSMCFLVQRKQMGHTFFGTPKKNGQIWIISDFCQLNKWIICWPYPQCHAFMNYSNALKGLLTVLPLISTWDSAWSP
jgi:hypothetical protein